MNDQKFHVGDQLVVGGLYKIINNRMARKHIIGLYVNSIKFVHSEGSFLCHEFLVDGKIAQFLQNPDCTFVRLDH